MPEQSLSCAVEIWKPIPSTDGYYEASSLGRVRRARPGASTRVGRILRPATNRLGYLVVVLHRNGHIKHRYVHSLVAEAFIGPCPDGLEINHKNGRKADNCPSNLEYCSHSENFIHALSTGLAVPPRGSRHGCARLCEEDVIEIRRRVALGTTQAAIGREYGVAIQTINKIIRGKTWKHVV
mgnify:FL=1